MPASNSVVVVKFGGTSLASAARMRVAALRIRRLVQGGVRPVVVVSAPGATTDGILAWIAGVAPRVASFSATDEATDLDPGRLAAGDTGVPALRDLHGAPAPGHRESDRALATGEDLAASLLALALGTLDVEALSLRGGEAGIRAGGTFGAGVVREVDAHRLRTCLGAGIVPVVAGFQAESESGETVTLGRGGSDWTAVLLASKLSARECHIVTDVAAVYEEDPRVNPHARPFRSLPHTGLAELVARGSRVVHPDAAVLALKDGVRLRIYGYWEPVHGSGGTLVDRNVPEEWGDTSPGDSLVEWDEDLAEEIA